MPDTSNCKIWQTNPISWRFLLLMKKKFWLLNCMFLPAINAFGFSTTRKFFNQRGRDWRKRLFFPGNLFYFDLFSSFRYDETAESWSLFNCATKQVWSWIFPVFPQHTFRTSWKRVSVSSYGWTTGRPWSQTNWNKFCQKFWNWNLFWDLLPCSNGLCKYN